MVLSVTTMKNSKLLKTFNGRKIIKIITVTSGGFHTPRNSKIYFCPKYAGVKKIIRHCL